MTISSTSRVAGPFIGNGATATFPFAFKVFTAPDLLAVTCDVASGTITTLALTADYTVVLNADQDANAGGSITLVAGALAAGLTLTLTTDMAELQNVDLTNGGAFYPDVINGALDTLTILIQQLSAQVARSLQAPIVDNAPSVVLPAAAERAGTVLAFDGAGNPILVTMGSGNTLLAAQKAVGNVDGNNTTFSFTAISEMAPAVMVFAGGVYQTPSTDYGAIVGLGGGQWQIPFVVAPAQGPITVVLLS